MAACERRGGRAVADALADPSPPGAARVVVHLARRFVAAAPARLVEPPDEVDVLAEAETLVEAADLAHRSNPAHDRSGGHVADAGAAADAGRFGPEVEWAAIALVAGDRARAVEGADARGDERHAIVGEVGEQCVEPAVGQFDIGVDECDEGCGHVRSTGIAGSGGAAVGVQAERGAGDRRRGAVVDHDRAVRSAGWPIAWSVTARHDDGDIGLGERAGRRRRVDRAGFDQRADERGRHDRIAVRDLVDERGAGVGDPEQLERRPADDHTAEALHAAVEPVRRWHSSVERVEPRADRRERRTVGGLRRRMARVGSPRTPVGLTACTPWRTRSAIATVSGPATACSGRTSPGCRARSSDVSMCPACRSPGTGAPRRRRRRRIREVGPPDEDRSLFVLEHRGGATHRIDVAAVPVHQHHPFRPSGRPHQLDEHGDHRLRADRERACKALVLTARGDRRARAPPPVGVGARRRRGRARWRSGCRCRSAGADRAARTNRQARATSVERRGRRGRSRRSPPDRDRGRGEPRRRR